MMLKKVGRHAEQDILEACLQCGRHRVSILNYGCVVRQWQFDTGGEQRDMVLGFERFEDYPEHSKSFGIVAGRVANRTSAGRFELDGKVWQLSINNGRHHLHGGQRGLGSRVWQMEVNQQAQSAQLSYLSDAAEQGYPGQVKFTVTYSLDEAGLHCDMRGEPNIPTPVNLAQHNYYNLDGSGDIRQHSLQINADHYLPVDDELIPTGEVSRVSGTRFDFRNETQINVADPQALGHDHNLCLREDRELAEPAARLLSSDRQICLAIITDQPGLQLYTAKGLSVPVAGLQGDRYGAFGGICLEAQMWPDTLNQASFLARNPIIATPDQPYQQRLSMLISSAQPGPA